MKVVISILRGEDQRWQDCLYFGQEIEFISADEHGKWLHREWWTLRTFYIALSHEILEHCSKPVTLHNIIRCWHKMFAPPLTFTHVYIFTLCIPWFNLHWHITPTSQNFHSAWTLCRIMLVHSSTGEPMESAWALIWTSCISYSWLNSS